MPTITPVSSSGIDPANDLQILNGGLPAGIDNTTISDGNAPSVGGYVSPYANQSSNNNQTVIPASPNSQSPNSQTTTPALSMEELINSVAKEQQQPNIQQNPQTVASPISTPQVSANSTPVNSSSQMPAKQATTPSPQNNPIEPQGFTPESQKATIPSQQNSSQDISLKSSSGLNPDADLVPKQAAVDLSSPDLQGPVVANSRQNVSQANPQRQNTNANELDIKPILDLIIAKNASDMHLSAGYPIHLRIDGNLVKVGNAMSNQQVKSLIFKTLNANQRELLEVNKEVDLSYAFEDKARFRVNAYYEKGNMAAAYRLIPSRIKTMEELKLPEVIKDFTLTSQGLFLVTGPTGSGKSTTLASMLNEINSTQPVHIITLEDPIEYVYPKGLALVDQREIGQDTHDWSIALKSILRQDPDTVLIGEMRDYQTIQAAITTAETGHLVFGTLHTSSAAQSIDRIIDVFPPHQQSQIRSQLAVTLRGIVSQRLIPIQGGGREAAFEILVVTPAVSNLIREGKTYQIDNVISTSTDLGMVMMEKSLSEMVKGGRITLETAQEYSIRPDELIKMVRSGN